MLSCRSCKTIAEEEDLFCGECGTKIVHPPKKIRCASCKTEIRDNAKFCPECGVPRTGTKPVAPAPAQPESTALPKGVAMLLRIYWITAGLLLITMGICFIAASETRNDEEQAIFVLLGIASFFASFPATFWIRHGLKKRADWTRMIGTIHAILLLPTLILPPFLLALLYRSDVANWLGKDKK